MRIAVTIGDAAGVGPEVIVKSLSRGLPGAARVLVVGDAAVLNALAKKLRLKIRFENVPFPEDAPRARRVPCYFQGTFPASFKKGVSQKSLSSAAVRAIETAVALAMQGKVDAIVTAPVNKAGLKEAGFNIPGHTEYLAKLSGTKRYEMMLAGGPLRVVLVTRHTALKDVPKKITAARVEEVILLTDRELRRSFGIRRPRIVVCGLNPHAGEAGTIGREEIKQIAPGVRAARRKTDAEITGPLSPDALFYDAYTGRYDAEVCMYHDQGLIPLKMISRGHGVNVTLGLPFVRTSPDHGTAYGISGRLIADPGSMTEAIKMAVALSLRRKKNASAR